MNRTAHIQFVLLLFILCFGSAEGFSETMADNDFVKITGGCFQMGDQFGDGVSDEVPVHLVCLSDFYISKYEVTQEQWQHIMGNNPSKNQRDARYPVDVVNWHEVEEFIEKLNSRTNGNFRLPTEAEWEFACRAGGKKVKYGTADGTSADHLLISSDNDVNGMGLMPVGSFPPNELGLYDMSGNVSEWVQDWYDRDYYTKSPIHDPIVLNTRMKTLRVRRGGHWGDNVWIHRCTFRNWRKPSFRLIGLGFRLAKDL